MGPCPPSEAIFACCLLLASGEILLAVRCARLSLLNICSGIHLPKTVPLILWAFISLLFPALACRCFSLSLLLAGHALYACTWLLVFLIDCFICLAHSQMAFVCFLVCSLARSKTAACLALLSLTCCRLDLLGCLLCNFGLLARWINYYSIKITKYVLD